MNRRAYPAEAIAYPFLSERKDQVLFAEFFVRLQNGRAASRRPGNNHQRSIRTDHIWKCLRYFFIQNHRMQKICLQQFLCLSPDGAPGTQDLRMLRCTTAHFRVLFRHSLCTPAHPMESIFCIVPAGYQNHANCTVLIFRSSNRTVGNHVICAAALAGTKV